MGQYGYRPRSRHFKDIFKDKVEEKKQQEYLRMQKEDVLDVDQEVDTFEGIKKERGKKERVSKQEKAEKLRTFKIYKHIDKIRMIK